MIGGKFHAGLMTMEPCTFSINQNVKEPNYQAVKSNLLVVEM